MAQKPLTSPPLPDPEAKAEARRCFRKELLIASGAHLLLFLFLFRGPLLSTGVDSFQARPDPPAALSGMSEMVYQLQPALFTQARIIRSGEFPSWSPYSQGGTPLIGKMQNAVFAPYHLLLYVFPGSWTAWLFMLVVFLKSTLTFLFAYIYARTMKLSFWAGVGAAMIYLMGSKMIDGLIFSWFGPGMYLPLILTLIEMNFRGYRRLSRMVLPWALALPFFSGHFESAFRLSLSAAVYFLVHLWFLSEERAGEKVNLFGAFAVGAFAALVLASVQILPALEYVDLSYNKVWHGFLTFWQYETIGKVLAREDLSMLLTGLLSLGGFGAVFRSCMGERSRPWSSGALGLKALAALLLACGLACLANLGYDASLRHLAFAIDTQSVVTWLLGFVLIFLAFRGLGRTQERGLRILGLLAGINLLVLFKLPPLTNAMLEIPLFTNLHNTLHRLEFNLFLAVLAAAALDRAIDTPWAERGRKALYAAGLVCVVAAGFLGSQELKRPLLRLIGTSVFVPKGAATDMPGGMMGPEYQQTFDRDYAVAGWVSSLKQVAAVRVSLVQDGKEVRHVDAAGTLENSGARQYFSARLGFPAGYAGTLKVVSQIIYSDGARQLLHGAHLEVRRRGKSGHTSKILIAGVLALPLLLLIPSFLARSVLAVLVVLATLTFQFKGIAAGQIPFDLPGLEKISGDPEPSRVSSLDYNFLQADYPNVYGLSDIRTGGDNLDVLTEIYFSHIVGSFLGRRAEPKALETVLKLWGLANVRYLLAPPGAAAAHPALKAFYAGPDLTIMENTHYKPRALFFSRYAYQPLGDWRDWDSRGRFLQPLAGMLDQGKLDLETVLVLNDEPAAPPPAFSGAEGPSSVKVKSYSPSKVVVEVEAPRAGFVFLSDNHFPGWKAWVDGRSEKILRSWITFRAVAVPGGKSRIVFAYEPWKLRFAVLLACLLSLGWLWAYGGFKRSGAVEDPVPEASGGKKKKKAPPLPDLESVDPECAFWSERLLVVMVCVSLLFWSIWSAFIFHGGLQRLSPGSDGFWVNLAAFAALAAAAAAMVREWGRRRRWG